MRRIPALAVLLVGTMAGCAEQGSGTPEAGSVVAKSAKTGLAGRQWRLSMLDSADALAGVEVTVHFDPEGRVYGNSGCNRYSGSYRVQEDSLYVTALAGTRMMCAEPAGTMDQEDRYLASLEQAQRYRLLKTGLIIITEGPAVRLEFQPMTDSGSD